MEPFAGGNRPRTTSGRRRAGAASREGAGVPHVRAASWLGLRYRRHPRRL